MKIRSIRILNYKCFNDSGEITIPSSFTIITGKNNAGKTAFSQAVSLTIEDKPHRSLETAPSPTTPPKGKSSVQLKIDLSVSEFYELVSIYKQEIRFPKNPGPSAAEQIKAILSIFEKGIVPLLLDYGPSGFNNVYLDIPCTSITSTYAFQFIIPSKGNIPTLKGDNIRIETEDTAPLMIAPRIKDRIYLFKAERFNVGRLCNILSVKWSVPSGDPD